MNKKISQKNLIARLERNLEKSNLIQKGDKIVVALSGGPDSICLFDLLNKLKDKYDLKLIACHYNHKMRGKDSDRDESFVVKLCLKRGVKLIKETYGGRDAIKSEQEAREVRYTFFNKILKHERGASLAIAHNADDLAETLLFRLVRGSGPKGLKSIPQARKNFIRPLLNFRKDEILKYLKDEGCKYCYDSSNKDTKYKRNYIRHKIIPHFLKINPKAIENIRNFSRLMEEQNDYIDKITQKHFDKLVKIYKNRATIDLEEFIKLDHIIQSNLIIKSASHLGYSKDISIVHIDNVLKLIRKGEGKKYLPLPHSLRVEVKNGKIYLS